MVHLPSGAGSRGNDGSVTVVTVIAITLGDNVASARAGNAYLWSVTKVYLSPLPSRAAISPERPFVRPITNKMERADYERERAAVREAYDDSSQEAGAKCDQALAKLFYRSGSAQEALAEVVLAKI